MDMNRHWDGGGGNVLLASPKSTNKHIPTSDDNWMSKWIYFNFILLGLRGGLTIDE